MRYSVNLCPRYQYAVDILSKRWTPLIIKVLMDKPLRFSELAEVLTIVSDRVLSERLKELESEKILERHVYPETPVRVEYSLTESGRDLAPVVQSIEDWSHRWVELDDTMPVVAEEA
jgi:DNA-binding HxlR family transcriptional regulator